MLEVWHPPNRKSDHVSAPLDLLRASGTTRQTISGKHTRYRREATKEKEAHHNASWLCAITRQT